MSKIILIIFFLTLFSCDNFEENLDNNFKNELIKYQKKFPIPINSIKGQYIYIAFFNKSDNDTIMSLSRSSSGLIKGYKGYGVFEDDNLKSTFIYDEKNYSKNFVYNNISNKNVDIFYANNSNKESYPPIFKYLIKKKQFKLIKIDTIWQKWN